MPEATDNSDMSTTGLDDKNDFHELTPKQQSIVDVKAKHPEYGPKETAEKATQQLEGDESVSRSYVSPILKKYGHIIQDRREQLDNKRYEGDNKTVGDPFQDKLNDSQGWQGIKDRPNNSTNDNFITVRVWQDDLEQLLQGEVSNEFQKELLNELTQKAFA